MSGCQDYGPFLDPYYNTAPNNLGYPEKDHNFDNYPCGIYEGHRDVQGCTGVFRVFEGFIGIIQGAWGYLRVYIWDCYFRVFGSRGWVGSMEEPQPAILHPAGMRIPFTLPGA